MVRLCNGDVYRPLMIEVWDYDDDGKHDFMGQVATSVDSMLKLQDGDALPVIEPELKEKKKGYTNSGVLPPSKVHIDHIPSFCDVSVILLLRLN